MADNRQNPASSLFFPLVGEEQAARLEEKFGHILDDEDEEKSSKCNLETTNSSQWLHSNKGASPCVSYGKSQQRSHQNKKRSNKPIGRLDSPSKHQKKHYKPALLPEAAINDRKSIGCDWALEGNSTCIDNVGEFGTEKSKDTDMADGWDNGSQPGWGNSLADTERPKLAIVASSTKVEFRLSTDSLQPAVVVPAPINQYLRDYQREGIRFLYQHYTARTGAILGDDMGLGKTIQVIGFISALLGKQGNSVDTIHSIPKFIRQMSDDMPDSPPKRPCKPFLIIGPSAVMYNWLDELKTWGYFTASKFHGTDKETCLDNLRKQKLEVVVTTFETFRDYSARLNQVEWEAVIVDEVHKIKGLKAQVTQALRTINTPCRFGLTGTALQNNMTELWSLLDWAQPGVLGTLEQFERKFVQVIELGQRHDATKRELAQARRQKEIFSEIRKRMLLRRTKSLIADQLPSKEDLVVMCRLSDLQTSVYRAILAHPDMKLVLCAEDPCDCRSGKARASCCYKRSTNDAKVWTLVFSFMHLMLKAANHMALLIPDKNTRENQAALARSVCDVAFKAYPQFIQQTPIAAARTLSDPQYCGKMKVLQGLLSAFHANHDKVLIFSYSTRLLDIIEQYVISQGHGYRRIDGKVSSLNRRNIVVQFNHDSNIFLCLISTKSGSLGLNLTGANKVVIFDPNWNPSHDLQAQDRAYRIGQTRDVKVYRLVSAGTIEENIYLRQIYKQQLDEIVIGTSNARRYFHGIQGDKANRGELFGIKNMFSLRADNSCLTMDILKRNDQLEKGLAGYDITRYIPSNKVSTESDDDESSDSGGESLADSTEEEDEDFLRQIFGSERSPIVVAEPHNSTSISETSLCQASVKSSTKQNKTAANMESDNEDGEISLIPKLHKRNANLACFAGKNRILAFDTGTSAPPGYLHATSLLPDVHGGAVSNGTFSNIIFSSTTCKTSDVLLQNQSIATESRKRGAIFGISWLFSDSDDDDDEGSEKQVANNEDIGVHSSTANLNNEKYPRSSSAKSFLEKSNKSATNIGGGAKITRNVSPERCRGPSESSTTAEKQSEAAKDSVTLEQMVLKSSDVLHTHANAKVVGSSRAEDHMTRCAMQDVFELHTNSQVPALQCDPYSQDEDLAPTNKKSRRDKKKPKDDHNTVKCITSDSFKILVGQTPTAIKRQEWSDFCKFSGVDQLVLAKTLLTVDLEKRLSMLREFYSQKHPQLAGVIAQVFVLKQTDPVPEKEQDKRAKQPHRKKVIKSAHVDNSSTDNRLSSNRLKDESLRGPNHSSSRQKSITKRSKPLTKLFNRTCLSSQSEDSVIAFSPEKQSLSSSDNLLDSFLPTPYSAPRRPPRSSVKVLPRSRTRLRCRTMTNFGGDGLSVDNTFSLNETDIDGKLSSQHIKDDSTIVISTASNSHYDRTTCTNAAEMKTVTENVEDIPTLLQDMGQSCHVRTTDNVQNYQSSSTTRKDTYKGRVVCEKKEFPEIDTIITASSTDKKTQSKSEIATKKAQNAGENNIACILDDIFSSGQNSKEKQNTVSNTEFKEEDKNTSILNIKLSERASTSKCSEQPDIMTKVTKESVLCETGSIFDDLLRTNTLKDERVDSLIRPSRKRNLTETKIVTSDAKEKWEADRERVMAADIDDLSWCKFNTGNDSPKSDEGSWSLFS